MLLFVSEHPKLKNSLADLSVLDSDFVYVPQAQKLTLVPGPTSQRNFFDSLFPNYCFLHCFPLFALQTLFIQAHFFLVVLLPIQNSGRFHFICFIIMDKLMDCLNFNSLDYSYTKHFRLAGFL